MFYFVYEVSGKILWNRFEKIKPDRGFTLTPFYDSCGTEQFNEKLILFSIL